MSDKTTSSQFHPCQDDNAVTNAAVRFAASAGYLIFRMDNAPEFTTEIFSTT